MKLPIINVQVLQFPLLPLRITYGYYALSFLKVLHFDQDNHGDYMTGLVQTISEAIRSYFSTHLIVMRDSFGPRTCARIEMNGSQPTPEGVTGYIWYIIFVTYDVCVMLLMTSLLGMDVGPWFAFKGFFTNFEMFIFCIAEEMLDT